MKIALDPQIFNNQVFGGISRYYTEIFSHLSKNKEVTIEVPILTTDNVHFRESKLFGKEQKMFTLFFDVLEKIGISVRRKKRKLNIKRTFDTIKDKEIDLFVPTYYDPYFLNTLGDIPFVVTVYDMIHELFPEYFIDDQSNVVKNKKLLLEKAAKVIVVSNNTKKDILTLYPHIDPAKIEVIYHGNSITIDTSVEVELPERYILFVGVRKHYKNFYFLVDAIEELLKKDKNLYLVCAGSAKFDEEETAFIKEKGIESQIIHKEFKDAELGIIYKKAICFVFPSMYEGFGIPVLEAMASGCPIILTNNSSFPEVAGNAGIFFELNNAADLKNKVEMILNDCNLREEYIQKGLEQIKKYDWENASQQCLEVYKKAIIDKR